MKLTNRDNNLLIFCLLIIAIVAFLFYLGNYKFEKKEKENAQKFLELQNSFINAPIEAKAFIVYDTTQNKEIYNKNGDAVLPLASLAKTMTAIISLKENSLDQKISISANALNQEGNYGFSIGEEFNIIDLVKLTLIGSINDSAQALAESVKNYLNKMNLEAKKHNLSNTLFLNTTGLDINKEKTNLSKAAGAYGTAKEINQLAIYATIRYPLIFKATALPEIKIKSNLGKIYTIKNTNEIIEKIPNVLFSKTGYTEIAGGNLSIIFLNNANHKIAITLLGSTKEGRFTDMEQLVNLSYNIGYATSN